MGDPRTLNPYSYAANNPRTYTDPNGTYPIGIACDRGCPLDEDNPDYPWFVLFKGPGYNNTPSHARDLARAMRGNTQLTLQDAWTMLNEQRQKASPVAQEPPTESRGPVALTDSYCNVATLFSRNVTCASNQQPPPGGFDLIDAAGAVLDAATSDCAVGIVSLLAVSTVGVAVGSQSLALLASGYATEMGIAGGAAAAGSVTAYQLGMSPGDVAELTGSLADSTIAGLAACPP